MSPVAMPVIVAVRPRTMNWPWLLLQMVDWESGL